MLGLPTLPAANVCFIDAADVCDPERWIAELERGFLARGATRVRFYEQVPTSHLRETLTRRGYTQRCEIVHGKMRPLGGALRRVGAWHPISGHQWNLKSGVHERSGRASDGYDVVTSQWVEMERRKSETGNLEFFLFYVKGQPVATIGLLRIAPDVVRLKNFLVKADYRRQGMGRTALQHLFEDELSDCEGAVILSVEGSPGHDLYQSLGLREIGRTYEWTRLLTSKHEQT
jgi:GNAT superfamily N-acetyltransferase